MVSCINLQGSINTNLEKIWYLINVLKFYSTRYEKVAIFDDFNIEAENKLMKDFL